VDGIMEIKNLIEYLSAMGLMTFMAMPLEVSAIKARQKILIASHETDGALKFNIANNGIFNAPGIRNASGICTDSIGESSTIGSLYRYPETKTTIRDPKIGDKVINYWVAGDNVAFPVLMNQQSYFGFCNIFNTWAMENGAAPIITNDLIASAFYYCMRDEFMGVIPNALDDKISSISTRLGDSDRQQDTLISFSKTISDIIIRLSNIATTADYNAIRSIMNQFLYEFIKNISSSLSIKKKNNLPRLDAKVGNIDLAGNNRNNAPICAFWADEMNLGICEFADAAYSSLMEIINRMTPRGISGEELTKWAIGEIKWFEVCVYLTFKSSRINQEDFQLLQIVSCSNQLVLSHRLLKRYLNIVPVPGMHVAKAISSNTEIPVISPDAPASAKLNASATTFDKNKNFSNNNLPSVISEMLSLLNKTDGAISGLGFAIEKSLFDGALAYFKGISGIDQYSNKNTRTPNYAFPKQGILELRGILNENAQQLQQYVSQLQQYVPQLHKYISEFQQIGIPRDSQSFIDGINSINMMLNQVVGYYKCLDRLLPSSVDVQHKLNPNNANGLLSKATVGQIHPKPESPVKSGAQVRKSQNSGMAQTTHASPSLSRLSFVNASTSGATGTNINAQSDSTLGRRIGRRFGRRKQSNGRNQKKVRRTRVKNNRNDKKRRSRK
jgi:hypothetical protein